MIVVGSIRGLALTGGVWLAILGGAGSLAFGQDQGVEPAADSATQPVHSVTRRSARLTFVAGAVQVQRTDNTGEDTALLNMPVTEGTRLITSDYAQAEIEFEDGSVVRMTPRSTVVLTALALDSASVAHTELSVLAGLVYFELRKASTGTFVVDAGGAQASPVENVTLRVNLDEPPVSFAVLSGSARLERSDAFTTVLRTGESLKLDTKDESRYFLTAEVSTESWDRWNEERDQAAAYESDRRTAARDGFSGPAGYGWSDLDANGTWYDVPNVGRVWQPADAVGLYDDGGFDPYANGSWVWGQGGYVFVSAYNWGWTPYRCGNWWFYPGFGWVWQPNNFCSQWGYSGFYDSDVYFYNGSGGGRPIHIPRPGGGGGGFHPTLPVRAPKGIHPPPPRPRPTGGPVKIAGGVAKPLQPVGGGAVSHRESPIGKTLERDYPVDLVTRKPVLGVMPGSGVIPGSGLGDRGPGAVIVTEQPTRAPRGNDGGGARPGGSVPTGRAPATGAPGNTPNNNQMNRIHNEPAPAHPVLRPAPAPQQPVYRPAPPQSAPAPVSRPSPPPAAGPAPTRAEPAAPSRPK
jgi:hypothetical protein